MGKDKTQTTTQRLDPASQGYVNQSRAQAQAGADVALNQPGSFVAGPDQRSIQEQMSQFMDPYTQQVIGGLGEQYDQLRAGATRQANQGATAAGAFGGSRHGVAEGVRLGELDRAQGQQVGGLLSNQFNNALSQGLNYSEYQRALKERQLQEPLFRQQQAQGFMQNGLGPTGQDTTQTTPGNFWGDVAGVGLTVAGGLMGGPAGASIGSKIGGGFTSQGFSDQINQPLFPGAGPNNGLGIRANQPGPNPMFQRGF